MDQENFDKRFNKIITKNHDYWDKETLRKSLKPFMDSNEKLSVEDMVSFNVVHSHEYTDKLIHDLMNEFLVDD